MEKVDISKLKQDYPLLREWEDHYAYELYKQIESQQLITEYDKEVTVDSRYLYHLTPDTKWKSIKHIGLTPKTQGKLANHPGRIYLLTSLDGVDVEKLAFSLLVTYSQAHLVKEMYLLKVDTANLRDIKFFEDPNFFKDQAVWTYQNIPPTAISVVETFKY